MSSNNHLLDEAQRPAYLLAVVQQWLALTLRLVVAVALATQLRASAAVAGASLVTLMSFSGTVARVVETYTQLETSIGAVSRLKVFGDGVSSEALPGEVVTPPDGWPHAGAVEIKDISASYLLVITRPPFCLFLFSDMVLFFLYHSDRDVVFC